MKPAPNAANLAPTPPAIDTSRSAEIELARAQSALRRSRVCNDQIKKQTALRASADHTARALMLLRAIKF